MSPESRILILKDRAYMLQKARSFFQDRQIIEVDCPIISHFASVDAHIDLIKALYRGSEPVFLHSSPEYGMKRLLAEGMGDIYQLGHVFRDGEYGARHNPEFMIAEWYRLNMSFQEMFKETLGFIELFLGAQLKEVLSYKQAFQHYVGIDPYTVTVRELQALLPGIHEESKDNLLNYLLALKIEPKLGKEGLTVLAYYPPTQAALAKVCLHEDVLVAERFEVYYQGVELANGYHELQDPKEQLKRLQESNRLRKEFHKEELPIDMHFIEALKKGIPECSGVAVGFDRLMMLRHREQSLAAILPFDWQRA
ncbi:MAG: yjeA [Chlamydiia bacterium]|nr:yjeA [Chlamydiia bacterium]